MASTTHAIRPVLTPPLNQGTPLRGIAFSEGAITTSSRERDFRLSNADRHVLHQTLSRFCPNHGEIGPIPFAGPRVPQ